MDQARRDGLYLLLLGSMIFILLGVTLETKSQGSMSDFKAIYYGARCLLQHHDPYSQSDLLHVFNSEGGEFPSDPSISRSYRRAVLVCVNTPSAMLLVAPFALLSWVPSHLLWMMVTAGGLLFSAGLIWDISSRYSPVLSGGLIALILAGSESLLFEGNAAGIVISLCIVTVWTFREEKYLWAGVVCLALSLAIKPQDAGFVWLYFILAGGVYRRRAVQSLLIALIIGAVSVLWVSAVAPHWIHELRSNLMLTTMRGDLNDPGPSSMGAHGLGMMINLQTVSSIFWDDPRIYNAVSYLICVPLLLVWVFMSLRSAITPRRTWLALAAIAALSLLPVYHRQYDARLLLLTVPACSMLWAEANLMGRLAAAITAAGAFTIGDLPWVFLVNHVKALPPPDSELSWKLRIALLAFPIPTVLLLVGTFYLWAYLQDSPRPFWLFRPVNDGEDSR